MFRRTDGEPELVTTIEHQGVGPHGLVDIAGDAVVETLRVGQDPQALVRRYDSTVEDVPVTPGQWAYDSEGPANALVDLALGTGEDLSLGEVGARAVEPIEMVLASAARRDRARRPADT